MEDSLGELFGLGFLIWQSCIANYLENLVLVEHSILFLNRKTYPRLYHNTILCLKGV